ncbi:M48 family metalloprotease [Nioella nitratireducens]|uniref:M48 family metalloprotease n=1 Tax=Nioella nitratireducens TaxID=1287720 RepID=UPI0008FD58EC|nr:M48 family metalloprotease [Nioella nitratireducens]
MLRLARLVVLVLCLLPGIARAQSIIRDAEIEHGLSELATPVLRAAGLPAAVQIIVVDDGSLNAFVVDPTHIFIHSGLLMRLDRPEQVQAIIAHEAAHIANGHFARRAANVGTASTAARLGILLGVAAGVASGDARAAVGVAAGAASSAQRVFFAHTRAEEASADAAAIRYMISAGADPAAMLEVLDIFRGQEALSAGRQDPYLLTHPLTRDRVRSVQALVAGHEGGRGDDTSMYWFQRMTGKLTAFLRAPSWTLRRVGNDSTEIAHLRRAIAYMRQPNDERALAEVNALVQMRPADPYYQELRGQILYEARRYGNAISAYAQAVELAPRQPLILAGYGRALLTRDTASGNRQALEVLNRARARDPFNPRLLRDLALAHARLGQNGLASVATAERYALQNRFEDARIHATRASGLLPQGSSGWLRAQDVLSVAQIELNRR